METIEVNGETHELSAPLTLSALLARHRLAPERVVIELNREVLRDHSLYERPLRGGDKVEIVQLVGGG